MQFMEFIPLVLKWISMPSSSSLKKSKVLRNKAELPEDGKELFWLAICESYKFIFPNFYHQEKSFTNEFFLDFCLQTTELNSNTIIVTCGKDLYCFLPEEILNIFHNDLYRSNTILFEETVPNFERQGNIHNTVWTLQRSFRLPVNPWSNKTFTFEQITEIISQLALLNYLPSFHQMPEVVLFLIHCQKILVAPNIQEFFEKQGLKFEENIQPYWVCECRAKNFYNYTSELQTIYGECKPLTRGGKKYKCRVCNISKTINCQHSCMNHSQWKGNLKKFNYSFLAFL
jgi:hypothetical protein